MFKQLSSCRRLIHQMNCYHISPLLNSSIQLYQQSQSQSQLAVGAGMVRNQLSSISTSIPFDHHCTNQILDTYSSNQNNHFSTRVTRHSTVSASAVCFPTSSLSTSLCTRSTRHLPTFNQQQQWNYRPHRSFTTNTATTASSKPPSPVTPMKPRTVTEANAAAAAATPNPHFQRQERLEAATRQRAQAAASSSSSNPFRSQSTSDAAAAAVQQQQKVAFDAFKVRSQRDLTISQYLFFSVVAIVSLLGGASIVHNIYKPDLTLPEIKPRHLTTAATDTDKQSTNPPSTPSTKQQ